MRARDPEDLVVAVWGNGRPQWIAEENRDDPPGTTKYVRHPWVRPGEPGARPNRDHRMADPGVADPLHGHLHRLAGAARRCERRPDRRENEAEGKPREGKPSHGSIAATTCSGCSPGASQTQKSQNSSSSRVPPSNRTSPACSPSATSATESKPSYSHTKPASSPWDTSRPPLQSCDLPRVLRSGRVSGDIDRRASRRGADR